jgi:hypothetical protein
VKINTLKEIANEMITFVVLTILISVVLAISTLFGSGLSLLSVLLPTIFGFSVASLMVITLGLWIIYSYCSYIMDKEWTKKMNREHIIEQLHKGVCTVEFTKVNGENRTMRCTLNAQIGDMPEIPLNETVSSPVNQDTVKVWDIDAAGWRSFRVESVSTFSTPVLLTEG